MGEVVDVAVVGGGVIGLSVARELGLAGVERVAVLEREGAVGLGSSSRANGGFRAQFTTRPNVEFSLWSIDELENLERRTGLLSLQQVGYLLVTGTPEGERSLRTAFELQRSLGVATEWLEPHEVIARAPFLRPEGIRAGTFHARDGILDPHGLVQAMRREAVAAGARILTAARVRALSSGAGGLFDVRHEGGWLRARWVVNAAGADAREVAAMLGLDVPVTPVRRNLAFARDPGGDPTPIPMCVDLDTGVLVRREPSGGYVIAYSDPNDPPSTETTLDPAFLDAVAARIGNRFPFLSEVPIDPGRCWAGLYPETPDHHAIVGACEEVPRFLQCVGFGGHGLMHAPAAGHAIAELVTAGRCTTFDLHPLRPARFAEGDLVVETAVL
ncbi:MAG TPA: FAD-dependent oxidoreductase [Actinomycetota bacterium]|nr:FAD-dependent oxidoreductase [Actinomycetota bacterium]